MNPAMGIAALVALTLVTACSTSGIRSYHDYNPNVDFANLQTWSFIGEDPMIVSAAGQPVNPLLQDRIMTAIRLEMAERRLEYVEDPEAADMVVSFTIGSRDRVQVDEYPVSYRVGYRSYHSRGAIGISYGTETRVRQYTEGQLAIDIFEVETRTPAFHGTATKRISEADRDDPGSVLRGVVAAALKGFPPDGDGEARPQLLPLDGEG